MMIIASNVGVIAPRCGLIGARLRQGWHRTAGMCNMIIIVGNVGVVAPGIGLIDARLGQGWHRILRGRAI